MKKLQRHLEQKKRVRSRRKKELPACALYALRSRALDMLLDVCAAGMACLIRLFSRL